MANGQLSTLKSAVHKVTGEVVEINNALRGNKCDCICPICGEPVQARKGMKRDHHFKHISSVICKGETILHKLAKEIFPKHDKILLPENKGWFEYVKVDIEHRTTGFIPDVALMNNSGEKLYVEIAITSFIQEIKHAKIKNSKVNTIEVDLSRFCRIPDEDELTEELIFKERSKKIIYWQTYMPFKTQYRDEITFSRIWIFLSLSLFIMWLFNRIIVISERNR